MKTLIVCYSLNGNSAWIAEQLAARAGADVLRIEPVKAYPEKGLGKFLHGGRSAMAGASPELRPYTFDADAYERVVFGFPVWASRFTPPIRTFIRENREALRGKKLAAFTCQAGSGAEKALAQLKEELGIAAFEAEAVFIDPKTKPSEENERKLEEFAAKLAE